MEREGFTKFRERELLGVREKDKSAKNLRLRGLGFFSVGDKEKQVEFQNEFKKVVLGRS